MRTFFVVVCLALVAVGGEAYAQNTTYAHGTPYTGAQRRYTDRDVLAIFGKTQARPAPRELLFDVGVNASIQTKMQCGRIGIGVNLGNIASRVSQLPQQIASQSGALMGALPMLALCYASPALCAELKNLNFQINERLKMLTDVCHGIDNYIDSQSASEMGEAAAQNRGQKACMSNAIGGGMSPDDAMDACRSAPPDRLMTDMARAWLADRQTRAEQIVIRALMENAGQIAGAVGERKYAFLSSVLGELKMDVNGKLLPVFPVHPIAADSVLGKVQGMAMDLACNTARLRVVATGEALGGGVYGPLPPSPTAPPDLAYFEQMVNEVVHEELDVGDAQNLDDLDPPDRVLACNALGRSVGKAAARRASVAGESTFALALANPQLPDNVRRMYEARADKTFKALLAVTEERNEATIRKLKEIIQTMADRVRQEKRNTAVEVSKGLQDWDREFSVTPCESEETCAP